MKRWLPLAGLLGLLPIATAPAAAAQPDACKMVHPSEYQRVLHKPVKLSQGEGLTSCNVRVRGFQFPVIIPNVGPYNAAVVNRTLARLGNAKQRIPALGPKGYAAVIDGDPMVWAVRHGWVIAFQTGFNPTHTRAGMPTMAQMIALTKIAYGRV
jgi:hypothetical protein